MNVIVVGGGKIGYYLCKTLMEHGHKPRIIEIDKELCNYLANELDIPVTCGDGTTIDTLESARVKEAEALVSVTGQDEDNLIACQLAKIHFGVRRTVAKVNNPKNASVLKKLGVDITVSATNSIAQIIEREVDTAAIKQLISLNRGIASLNEVVIPEHYKYSGSTLSELELPEESVVVSISRGDDFIIPRGNTQIISNDKIIVICNNKVLHELSKKLSIE